MSIVLPAYQGCFKPVAAVGGSGPGGVTGLEFWLDASQETGFSNGDEVSTAQDWSGNNRDATGVVSAVLKPTYRATDGPSGLPAFRMQSNATEQGGYFTLPDFLNGFTAGHHFTVVKLDIEPDSNSRAGPPLGDWGTSTLPEFYTLPSGGKIWSEWGSTVRHETVNPTADLTLWHVYEERSASGVWSNWIDGAMQFSTGTNTVSWGTAPKIGRHGIGGITTLFGMIAEVLFYDRVLDSSEIQAIYDYLETKYAITLP